jgi:hypothetical protein
MINLAEITVVTRSTFGEYSAKYSLNEYFVAHPEMVLGQFEERKAKWGDELTVIGGDAEVVAADMLKLCPVSAVGHSPSDTSSASTTTPGLPPRPTHSEPATVPSEVTTSHKTSTLQQSKPSRQAMPLPPAVCTTNSSPASVRFAERSPTALSPLHARVRFCSLLKTHRAGLRRCCSGFIGHPQLRSKSTH